MFFLKIFNTATKNNNQGRCEFPIAKVEATGEFCHQEKLVIYCKKMNVYCVILFIFKI